VKSELFLCIPVPLFGHLANLRNPSRLLNILDPNPDTAINIVRANKLLTAVVIPSIDTVVQLQSFESSDEVVSERCRVGRIFTYRLPSDRR